VETPGRLCDAVVRAALCTDYVPLPYGARHEALEWPYSIKTGELRLSFSRIISAVMPALMSRMGTP